MNYKYQFPEKNPFRASEVTDTTFRIEQQADWIERLFVDFGKERSKSFRGKFNHNLGLEDGKLTNYPNVYRKMVFSGHRGCGKSVELARYAKTIHGPEAYFVVLLDLEEVTSVESIVAEDIFVALITVLIQRLEAGHVKFDTDDFAAIAEELLPKEKEKLREVSNEFGLEVEAKVSAGWSFWKFLTAEGNLKGAYSRNNKTTQVVRQALNTNPKPALVRFNNTLKKLRIKLQAQNKGKDVLFVIDGLEKCNPAVYETLFVRDVRIITDIEAHIISTVPIRTYYEIQYQSTKDLFKSVYLGMLRLTPETTALLEAVILKRVDSSLFGDGVLARLTEMSGGCPRILLKLVNMSLEDADGMAIEMDSVERVIRAEGLDRWKALTRAHREILRSGEFDDADPSVLDLLQSLALLEYNGESFERKVNPLILPLLTSGS